MAGRPAMIDKAAPAVLEAIRRGMTLKDAAAYAGIDATTLHGWRRRGREELDRLQEPGTRTRRKEKPYVAFVLAFGAARAKGKASLIEVIEKAAVGGSVVRKIESVQYLVDGRVVKEKSQIVEETLAPDWRAAESILKNSFGWSGMEKRMEFDPSDYSDEELERIAEGEDVLDVVTGRKYQSEGVG